MARCCRFRRRLKSVSGSLVENSFVAVSGGVWVWSHELSLSAVGCDYEKLVVKDTHLWIVIRAER